MHPIKYRGWYYLLSTLLVLVEAALAEWMLITCRRYGNWARRLIVEPA